MGICNGGIGKVGCKPLFGHTYFLSVLASWREKPSHKELQGISSLFVYSPFNPVFDRQLAEMDPFSALSASLATSRLGVKYHRTSWRENPSRKAAEAQRFYAACSLGMNSETENTTVAIPAQTAATPANTARQVTIEKLWLVTKLLNAAKLRFVFLLPR